MNLDAGHLAIIGKSRKTSTQAFEGPNNPKGPDLSKSQQIFLSLVLKTRRKALIPRGLFSELRLMFKRQNLDLATAMNDQLKEDFLSIILSALINSGNYFN